MFAPVLLRLNSPVVGEANPEQWVLSITTAHAQVREGHGEQGLQLRRSDCRVLQGLQISK